MTRLTERQRAALQLLISGALRRDGRGTWRRDWHDGVAPATMNTLAARGLVTLSGAVSEMREVRGIPTHVHRDNDTATITEAGRAAVAP